MNPNSALNNSPYNYRDQSGRTPDLLWDAASLTVGVISLRDNVRRGDVTGAVVDSIGILADSVAVALPFVPGGAGAAIKAARAANAFSDASRALNGAGGVTRGLYRTSQIVQGADFVANGYQAYDAWQRDDFRGFMLSSLGVGVRGMQGLNRMGYRFIHHSPPEFSVVLNRFAPNFRRALILHRTLTNVDRPTSLPSVVATPLAPTKPCWTKQIRGKRSRSAVGRSEVGIP
jgi:hypothetical protein